MKYIYSANYSHWRNNTLVAKMETDKKYMILKMGDFLITTAGFGWYIIYILRGIRVAVENNYIPVIDWKNCKIPQYSADKVGKENIWEYFFEQPFNIGLDEAYKSENFFVVDDVRQIASLVPFDIDKFVSYNDKDVNVWREYFCKYIRLKKKIKDYFEEFENERLSDDLIGVLARGTDYAELKPVGHSKPISINEIFAHIDGVLENYQIFLATEDENILSEFESKYPGRVESVKAKRYKTLGYNTLNMVYKEGGYERDIKYLYSLYRISKCKKFICSACGGGIVASLMRENAGKYYKFLYHGSNSAKAIVVGSFIEKEQNQIILMGNKPIMYYALNTLKLLNVEEVDLILSEKVKLEYQEKIGNGEEFGIKVNYIISNTYNALEYMLSEPNFMSSSKLVLLYADYFVHGADVIKDMTERINGFDGAYLWGTQTYFSDNTESIHISDKCNVPEKAYINYIPENYSLVGRYVFDYELKQIVEQIKIEKKELTLVDIINEYIHRKKIFFIEYKRGIICSKLKDGDALKKTDQLINLLEGIQKQKIGNFDSFKR